ncbi:hypothetical protein FH972_027324 [Carpinus fangiana]|uniref:Uncharacterized protein n=1 Tax=Carpinus fangiana TaxID=176857 RepID=A0A5N6QA76_9ROSI|nr:hypothetical protein FH972_027324 [Carpinus fangiana]
MAFESQSLKKKSSAGVFGDVLYGTMMLPKELEIEKERNFEQGFQVPDVGRVINIVRLTHSLTHMGLNPLLGDAMCNTLAR